MSLRALIPFGLMVGISSYATLDTVAAQGIDLEVLARQEHALLQETLCPAPGTPALNFAELFDPQRQRMEPARVFDNLYVLGMKTVVAWALQTSDGIILFESMFAHNVEETVVGGLGKLGLDPSEIRYVIISHGHADHFGGARFLQDAFGARIVMSERDWDFMHEAPLRGAPPPFPRKDIAVRDGYAITLGDTRVELYLTPGHTPGTLSSVFPVRDGGNVHYVGYLGGSGIPRTPEDILRFMASADRFARVDDRIDTYVSNHPMVDGTLLKLEALAGRRPGDPHPFVFGNAGFRASISVLHDCAGEILERRLADVLARPDDAD